MVTGRRKWAVMAGAAGAGAWWFRRAVVPARPKEAPTPQTLRVAEPDPSLSRDGTGVRIVVNPSAGPVWSPAATDDLRAHLPAADVHELAEDDDLAELLRDPRFGAIGVAGGDGTVALAASIAAERDVPLVLVPGGTLNHLARDLGLGCTEDAIEAARAGTVAKIDIGTVGDRSFVNTLTFGGYSAVVDSRERLEGKIGKWPALAVALARELPKMAPMCVEIDGQREQVWLGWIGNCAYDPPGLAPAWRERLDDGQLDLRILRDGPRARTRFLIAALTGRLSELPLYRQQLVESVTVEFLDGPPRLAADGETFDGPESAKVAKRPAAVRVTVRAVAD